MKLEIEKCLVLSTAHITQATAGRLTLDSLPGLIVYPKAEYGWLIYVHPDGVNAKEIPDELAKLILLAQQNDCVWLMLDRDGRQMDELPQYDW